MATMWLSKIHSLAKILSQLVASAHFSSFWV